MAIEGFIRNPTIEILGFIKPGALIERAEESAARGCGLHYELFESRLLNTLRAWHGALECPQDRTLFAQVAADRGWYLDDEAARQAQAAHDEVLRELREGEGEVVSGEEFDVPLF